MFGETAPLMYSLGEWPWGKSTQMMEMEISVLGLKIHHYMHLTQFLFWKEWSDVNLVA